GLDAIDSTKSGSTDTVTDNQFDHVGGVSINLHDAPADLARNVFTNDASPAIRTSGAAVTVECSSIQSGGVSGDGSLTVKENDFVPTVGFSGTGQSPRAWKGTAPIDSVLAANGSHAVSATGAHDCVPDPLHNLMTPAGPTSFTVDTAGLPNVSVNAPADLIGAGSAR